MSRDTQRQRLYDAEQAAFRDKPSCTATLAEAQQFVNRVLHHRWWRARTSIRRIDIHRGRADSGTSRACHIGGYPAIRLAPGHEAEDWILLHECAHHLAPSQAHHDRHFAATYLELVRAIAGEDWAERLYREYRRHGVEWRSGCVPAPERARQVVCKHCGRQRYHSGSWSLLGHSYCTKRCALEYARERTRKVA